MKQVRKASQVFSLVLLIAVFSGCEAGLTSSNNSGSADSQGNGFSFSDMYSRMNSLEEEIKNLKQVNQQQQDLLQQDISALNQTAWEAGGNAGDISWNGGSVGINTANPAADLDVGGIFQVDTTTEEVQTSRYVKEFSGRIRGPSNWPECTDGPKTVYIGTIQDSGSNSFITIELFGSHRGFNNSNNYFDYKKWVIMAGDKVSSNLVSASGGGDKVNLYNGSSTGNYNNIEIGSGFNIRLRVNPQCGSTMHYTYVVKYYSGANFTPHSTRYW